MSCRIFVLTHFPKFQLLMMAFARGTGVGLKIPVSRMNGAVHAVLFIRQCIEQAEEEFRLREEGFVSASSYRPTLCQESTVDKTSVRQ